MTIKRFANKRLLSLMVGGDIFIDLYLGRRE